MKLAGPFNSGAAVGNDGQATANIDTPHRLCGRVAAIYVKYNDSPPATTDVVIKTKGTAPAPPSYNLLALTDAAASGWFYPQAQIHSVVGAAIADEYTSLLIDDVINIEIDQANANDNVDVWLLLD
jgi:hypothetical protein